MRRGCWAVVWLGAVLVAVGGAAGAPRKERPPRVKVEIRVAQREPGDGLEEMEAPGGGGTIYVHRRAFLTNADIAKARAGRDGHGRHAVELTIVAGSRRRVAEVSRANARRVGAVFVDGRLVSAPDIAAEFSELLAIWGNFSEAEAERIAKGVTAE